MVFGLFSRKPQPPATQADTDNQISNELTSTAQLRTPSPSTDSNSIEKQNSPSREPPLTPSPPPERNASDLHALILSVPPQTLHSYTLTHLGPSNPLHLETLTHLSSFFADLVPPPRLHCVRCHKFFFEVENTDRSCLVPHDDDSAAVERVASSKSKEGTLYETLWGCCGRTVEGNGDMGPPDGWCYEGKHTADTKRARFRADSTLQDDKLTSCERLRCHEPPRSSRTMRKRGRPVGEDEEGDDDDEESSVSSGSPHSSNSRRRAVKKPRTHVKPAKEAESQMPDVTADGRVPEMKDADHMDIDSPPAAPAPAVAHTLATPPKSKPKSRAKPKPAPLSSKLTAPKTSSPLVLSPPYISHSSSPEPLSKSHTRVVISARSKPGTGASAPAPAPAAAPLKHKSSAASLKTSKPESPKPAGEPASPRTRTRTRSTSAKESSGGSKPRPKSRGKGKLLAEVVDSSVDGERHVSSRA